MKKLQKLDYWIAVPYALLSAVGVVMVFSASQNVDSNSVVSFLKQAAFVGFGWLLALLAFNFNRRKLRQKNWLNALMVITLVLLVMARLSPAINGAHGWIQLPGMTLQPVELAKFVLILYFADLFARHPWQSGLPLHLQWRRWKPLMSSFVLPAAICIMEAIMPDVGNLFIAVVVIMVIWLGSGVSYRWNIFNLTVVMVVFLFLQNIIRFFHLGASQSYAVRRLTNFVDPWLNIDQSRQLLYSYYAIAHGGLFGVGLGNSLIKPYLPESNTDFIMAVATEELGALMVLGVLIALLVLVGRLIYVGIQQEGQYERLVLFGIASLLLLQAFVNLGGVIGLLPITGVVFPFISGGGSSFIVYSIAIGLALNISAKTKQPLKLNPQDMVARRDYR
ncbi:FtsW/RodA/SpoVE family cell cycle protein [Leuconostocaceae bacterium ESL0723]|nr:FtsW/RodA/SpoVE family cell cycle protein [Leuconostocaceae bacterium ESL0723]